MKRDLKETAMVIALAVCTFAQAVLTIWLTSRM